MKRKVHLILACGGKGTRAKLGKNKLLELVKGKTCFERSLSAFTESGLIDHVIISANEADLAEFKSLAPNVDYVKGGTTRTESVRNALMTIDDGIVLIHDGARPFVSKAVIERCIDATIKYNSAIPLYPSANTIVKADSEVITDYLGKSHLYNVQTPQGFDTKMIKTAYDNIGDQCFNDDGEIFKNYYHELHSYMGEEKNIKLTFPEDFNKDKLQYRFGTGFDCHKLVEGRKLILGGVTIPHTKGLLGHSDADVLTHAIMDAILSSLSLRDIGYHFSDKDPQYKDISSMVLLDKVLELIKKEGYQVKSISASIMAEKPKLLNYIPEITKNLAAALSINEDCVGITATTLEGLGFVGREEGICVSATVMLEKI